MKRLLIFLIALCSMFSVTLKGNAITFDSNKTYYIYNKDLKVYLNFQSGSYTENNGVNATPVSTTASAKWKIAYDANNNVYHLSVNGTYLTQSSSYAWNTSQSSTAYDWTIEECTGDNAGYYYIKEGTTDGTNYLNAQSNGYAYTDGSKWVSTHWKFISTTLKDYTIVSNKTGGGIIYNSTSYTGGNVLNLDYDDSVELNPIEFDGYMSKMVVDVDAATITVTYVKEIFQDDVPYYIHNKSDETGKYLSFQTEYSETNIENATSLTSNPETFFKFKYDWDLSGYKVYVDSLCLSLSTVYPKWNTGYSTTAYGWIISESDIDGYYYIQKNSSTYLKSQTNGYAATDGSTSDYVHWEFIVAKNATLTMATNLIGTDLFDLDGSSNIVVDGTSMTIQDVIDDFDSFSEAKQDSALVALENAIKEPTNYIMPNGRYIIRNHKYLENGTEDTYLSSLASPLGIVEEAITYWNIWDITNNNDGTFTIVNEGNKYILTPTKTLDNDNPRDDGYLCYDTSKRFYYRIGSQNATSTITYRFIPGNILFGSTTRKCAAIQPTTNPTNDDGNYTYLYMDLENGDGVDRRNDHVAKSEAVSVVGTQVLWNLQKINVSSTIDADGTHDGETEMFSRMVDELAGYVGGVVTLENVTDVPCLNNINVSKATYKEKILNGATNGAELYRDIIEQIQKIKESPDEYVYYQDLSPEEISGVDTTTHAFFIENLCGSRPSYNSRLTQYISGSNPNYNSAWHFGWYTDREDNVVDSNGRFYVERSADKVTYHYLEDGVDITTDGYFYKLKNGNGRYLKMYDASIGNTDNVRNQVNLTENVDSAMQFVITPIIPGVWQIQDIQIAHTGTDGSIAETDNVYLTITKAAESTSQPLYGLTHYCLLETSALWRFETLAELKPVVIENLDVTSTTVTPKPLYATYSFSMNTMVSTQSLNRNGENTHLKPYRCVFAWKNGGRLRVDFVSLPPFIDRISNDTCYFFEAGKGYMIAGYSDLDTIKCSPLFVSDSSVIPDSCKLAENDNLLVGVKSDILINESNWSKIFALAYNSPDSIIGKYYGKDVYGVGMGFYQLPIGTILPAQSAYIPWSVFVYDETVNVYDIRYPYVPSEVKGYMPADMVFDDMEDNTTFVIQAPCYEIKNDKIYDLEGRQVSGTPQRGIYIINGKKVLIKN